MALPDVAMREAARVRANDTIQLASSEEEEEDVGVSAGMREANVEEAVGQAEQQAEADDLSQDEESTFIVKPAPHNLNSIWWRKAGFLKFCPFEHQDLQNSAMCPICYEAGQFSRGTVKTTGGSTKGLSSHFRSWHREKYDEYTNRNSSGRCMFILICLAFRY